MVTGMKKAVSLFIIILMISLTGIKAQEKITFTTITQMHAPGFSFGNTNNGKYIIKSGGSNYSRGYLNNVEIYEPSIDLWTTIGTNQIPRMGHNIAYVPSLNKLFIFNGEYTPTTSFNPPIKLYQQRQSKSLFTDIIEVIDLTENKASITDTNPYPVSGAGCVVYNEKVYFFGGWNPVGYSDRFYEYDPVKDSWDDLPDMPEEKQTTGKVVDGILYTFGGYDKSEPSFKSIHAYDFKEKKWSKVGELPFAVSANAIASDGKNIWLVGSYEDPTLLIAFDTKTKKVTTFESNLEGRRNAGAEVIGNILYVFGGRSKNEQGFTALPTQCTDISKYMK